MYNQDKSTIRTKAVSKDSAFDEMLRETVEHFKDQGIQAIQGFKEIVQDTALFEDYSAKLREGLSEDDSNQLEAMFDNQRMTLIKESTLGDIAPIAGLSMPMLRRSWIKCSLKNAIVTETATKPTFAVSYMTPRVITSTGQEYNPITESRWSDMGKYGNLPALTTDFYSVGTAVNLITSTMVNGVAASKHNGDALNTVLFIQKVKITVPTDGGLTTVVEVPVTVKVGLQGDIYGEIKTMSAHAVPADKVQVIDTLFGKVDFATGEVKTASALGLIKEVQFKGNLTQEANTRTDRVDFFITKKEINIPAASHIEAALSMEFIQDTMALYNIDATAEATNVLAEIVSQRLDQEISIFYEQCDMNAGSPYQAVFSAKPSAGFTGKPTEWRSELKTLINHWCVKVREDLQISEGYYVLMGNPLDLLLLDDQVTWTLKNDTDVIGGQMANYSMGVMTGPNTLKVISSSRVPKGKMRVAFFPTIETQKSYVYYPYSYILSNNLRSGAMGTANLPSIVVSKRHIMEEYRPMQFTISITNNDGVIPATYSI